MSILQQMADSMFPEGTGRPKAVAKAGSPAQLTNGLIVDAKEAVDALWKARGYLNMKPKQRKEKLGYSLDREEALGYLVTSALHMPLLSPEEARTIGKRAGSLPVFSKLAESKKRSTRAAPSEGEAVGPSASTGARACTAAAAAATTDATAATVAATAERRVADRR